MTEPKEFAAAVADALAVAKPKLRGWLHAVTAPLALAAGIVMVSLAPSETARLAAAAFVLPAFVLFATSALYHRGNWSPRAELRLKRMDHANIFLLIAGSYTPFAVLAMKGDTRVALMAAVWGTALLGIAFRVLWVGAPRWSYVPLYIGLGWAMAFVFPQLLSGAGVAAFVLVAVGGLLYTLGGLVYGMKRPNPSPRWFGFHEIFHTCTIAAFACQYIAASFVVYRAA